MQYSIVSYFLMGKGILFQYELMLNNGEFRLSVEKCIVP